MRPRRPTYLPGHYYHIYNRGTNREPIFRSPDNYEFVLRGIKRYLGELALALIAYCLMPNHYHWLVRQDGEQPAGLLAQRVFNSSIPRLTTSDMDGPAPCLRDRTR